MILISYSTAILEVFKKRVDVALAELGEQLGSEISEAFSNPLHSAVPWLYKHPSCPWPAQAQPAVLSQCWDPSGQPGCLQAAPGSPGHWGKSLDALSPRALLLGRGSCSHCRVFTLSPDRWAQAGDVYTAFTRGSRWPLSSQAVLPSLLPAGLPGSGLCQHRDRDGAAL